MRHITTHVACLAAAIALTDTIVMGQCLPEWTIGPFNMPADHGANGPVRAILGYDPPGPAPQVLVVAGDFQRIGGIVVNHIAYWDGLLWRPLGVGTNGPVFALTVHDEVLIVGGAFTSAGGEPHRRVAGWNGNGWLDVGDNVGSVSGFDSVNALAVLNGTLYAAGSFDVAGTATNVNNIVRLNGASWATVGNGLPAKVNALQVFDADGPGPLSPALFAGGQFASVYRLEAGWSTIGGPTAGSVQAMTVTNQGLIIGGDFNWIEGGAVDPYAGSIAAWDGTNWSVFESGGQIGVWLNDVRGVVGALRAFGSDLIVGGRFDAAGDVTTENLARWTGSSWQPFFGGVTATGLLQEGVRELRVYQGALVVVGGFAKNDSGGRLARNVIQHTGSAWQVFFAPRTVFALTQFRNRLVAGGYFAASGSSPAANAYHLASWQSGSITPFGGMQPLNGQVNALKYHTAGSGQTFAHVLVAAGEFTQAGDPPITVNCIAQWNESDIVGNTWSAMGSGFNNTVHALERFNGRTVAAGAYSFSGGTSLNRIARWTDVPAGAAFAWHAMGSGFNNVVRALKSYSVPFQSVQLVAAGDFTIAGGVTANRIASWTESTTTPGNPSWQPMGQGFNGTVHAVERHLGSTYAAGVFTASGATAVNRIARWTGSAWAPVGGVVNGGGFNGSVYALLSNGGFLYALGAFTSADGTPALRVARWDGLSWSAVDHGIDSFGYALSSFQTEVVAGGEFTEAAGLTSPGAARLLVGAPWTASVTASPPGPCRADYTFKVSVPFGYADVEYQWRKDGVPITQPFSPSGAAFVGAATNTLTVMFASDAEEGAYDCLVSNRCGSTSSPAVALSIAQPCALCPADIVPNDAVDVDDLIAVILGWGGCPPAPPCDADVNGSGAVDVDDLIVVILGWGPCPVVQGACCIPYSGCAMLSLAACGKVGGWWGGYQSACESAVCPPDNDECAFAAIAVAGATVFTNETATNSTGVPSGMCGRPWSRDVWFAYTPKSSGGVNITIAPQFGWDSIIEVYTHDSVCGSLTPLACEDDDAGCTSCHGNFDFVVAAGNTYLIRVASWAGSPGGQGELVITPQ